MITRATVYPDYHRQKGKQVKNLGWLLRNWASVKEFRVYTEGLSNPDDDAILTAETHDGRIYETGFASKNILWSFLHRPVFYGLTVIWDTKLMTLHKGQHVLHRGANDPASSRTPDQEATKP